VRSVRPSGPDVVASANCAVSPRTAATGPGALGDQLVVELLGVLEDRDAGSEGPPSFVNEPIWARGRRLSVISSTIVPLRELSSARKYLPSLTCSRSFLAEISHGAPGPLTPSDRWSVVPKVPLSRSAGSAGAADRQWTRPLGERAEARPGREHHNNCDNRKVFFSSPYSNTKTGLFPPY